MGQSLIVMGQSLIVVYLKFVGQTFTKVKTIKINNRSWYLIIKKTREVEKITM